MLVGIRTVLGTALELLQRLQQIPNAFERRLAASYAEPVRPRFVAPDYQEQKLETVAEKVAEKLSVKAHKPSTKTKDVAQRQSRVSKAKAYAKKRIVELRPMQFRPMYVDEPAERAMNIEPQIAPLDISEGLARLASEARERSRIAEAAERARADQIARDRAAEARDIARAQEAAREAQNMAAATQRAREAEARRNAEAAARARAAFESYERERARDVRTEADRALRAPYDVLGIAPSASADEIRAAYVRRSRQTHPDKPSGSAAAFREVKDAYERMIAAAPMPATRARADRAQRDAEFLREAAARARQAAVNREAARQAAAAQESARQAEEFARTQAAGRAAAAARAQALALDEARLDAEARAAASRKPNVVARTSMRLAERRANERAATFANMERADRSRAAAAKRR